MLHWTLYDIKIQINVLKYAYMFFMFFNLKSSDKKQWIAYLKHIFIRYHS